MYERNAGRPALGAAAADRRARAAQPDARTRSSRTPTSSCCWRGAATRVVGRIAAIDDRLHRETHGDNRRCSASSRPPTATWPRALLAAVEAWAAARGRAGVRGPISPSLNEMCGLLIDGFDTDPMLLMPHNPPEYGGADRSGRLRQGEGSVRLAARCSQRELPPVVRQGGAAAARQAPASRSGRSTSASSPAKSNASARSTAPRGSATGASSPPTDAEFRRIATELKPIFDPRCTVCAEVDGQMVACVVAVPDINQALKGTNGRLFPLGLIVRLLLRKRYIIAGAAAAARHRRALSRPRPLSAADRRVARAAAAARRTRAPSSRGCSKTTATSTSRPSTAARGATRPIASTRRRCEPADRRHRRVRLHRPSRRRASRRARRSRWWRCGGRSSPTTAARTRFDGADAVVHLAGVVSALREQDYIAANVDGTRAVAEAARAAGVPLIHISSLAAAGPAPPRAPRSEDDPPAPINAYGRSKLDGERAVAAVDGLRWTMLRPGVVYGPGDRALLPLFKLRAARAAAAGRPRRRRLHLRPRRRSRARDRRRGRAPRRRRHDLRRPPATGHDARAPRRRSAPPRAARARDRAGAAGADAARRAWPATSPARLSRHAGA